MSKESQQLYKLFESINTVYSLAIENSLDPEEYDNDRDFSLHQIAEKQQNALRMISEMNKLIIIGKIHISKQCLGIIVDE